MKGKKVSTRIVGPASSSGKKGPTVSKQEARARAGKAPSMPYTAPEYSGGKGFNLKPGSKAGNLPKAKS